MEEMTFTKDGLVLREAITSFGETNIEKKTVPYEQLGEIEADFDTGGHVPLDELFEIALGKNGGVESIRLQLGNGFLRKATVRPSTSNEDEEKVPPVPRVDLDGIEYRGRENFYLRMKEQPDSQPAAIRRIICSEGELTRDELDQLIDEAGYESSSGGTSQSLVVLEEVSEEIKRHGRGDDQRIVWTGAN
jgi:hypothetical protein